LHETTKEFVYKQIEKSHAAISKFMELVCLISAGSMAIIVSMAKADNANSLLGVSLVCMVVTCISVPVWHIGIARRSTRLINAIFQNPDQENRVSEELWVRATRVIALAAFVAAEMTLLLSWWTGTAGGLQGT
jgi:hypothetical protein